MTRCDGPVLKSPLLRQPETLMVKTVAMQASTANLAGRNGVMDGEYQQGMGQRYPINAQRGINTESAPWLLS